MSTVRAIGTYLPPWEGRGSERTAGGDEDALTLAVAAGRAALGAAPPGAGVRSVTLVSRALPLLEGGNAAALLAGLGLSSGVEVVERLGGAPATLDAVSAAGSGALVIGADLEGGAGAAAALLGEPGGRLEPAGRVHRSLPVRTRTLDGTVHDGDDARLVRERGLRASLDAAGLVAKPLVIAGVSAKDAAPFCQGRPPALTTSGASAAIFALAAMVEEGATGLVAGAEQATLAAADFDPSGVILQRDEAPAQPWPARRPGAAAEIKVALSAYDRAFDSKVRWEAGRCRSCATLAFPPRHRCLGCGAEASWDLVALPRTATVYTETTVHVPVPGLATPYTLAVVEIDGVGVRALVTVTDRPPGTIEIGDRGRLVLRRVAVRSGVPDYGYAFAPEIGP